MQQYNTKQRQILLEYLSDHSDENISALDIISHFAKEDISKSAIYRNLSSLEKDGKIRRVNIVGEKVAYYQYIDTKHCKGKIHVSCIKCGKTTHIDGDTASYLASRLKVEDGFALNNDETVLYGVCKDCQK